MLSHAFLTAADRRLNKLLRSVIRIKLLIDLIKRHVVVALPVFMDVDPKLLLALLKYGNLASNRFDCVLVVVPHRMSLILLEMHWSLYSFGFWRSDLLHVILQ